ncbi:hypothetical protein [uncultured Selenomonas sp.]|uniref:hypothetical protein n=1 Tax=uncultured Selenomonas sp. TaxID=159275 RepID=UPI0025F2D3DE|nr:hypothetical protein [uncultured Selenomonas sp.]
MKLNRLEVKLYEALVFADCDGGSESRLDKLEHDYTVVKAGGVGKTMRLVFLERIVRKALYGWDEESAQRVHVMKVARAVMTELDDRMAENAAALL